MKKGNRLAAMIMAAILSAGAVTGPVFAADYTATGEILTEEGSYDYSTENGGLTDETVPEDSALSIAPASADTDPAAVDEISSEAETEDEEGTEAVGEEEAEEETAVENGQDAETPDDTGVPAGDTASFDGPIDETEDVSPGLTDDGKMISDEMPGADQETEEIPAPVQEDNAFTEDQTATEDPAEILTEDPAEFLTEDPAEILTEDPAAVADPAPAEDDAAQTADTVISEEQGTEEIVSEEQVADVEGDFNPISADVTSMELMAGGTGQIYVASSYNGYSYYEEMTSVKSSDSSVLEVESYDYQYIEVFARKPGTAKVTIEGSYGTVLTVQVKVVSFLGKNSVTVKAENNTIVGLLEVDYDGSTSEPYSNHYSVSSSKNSVATAAIVEDNNYYYYVLKVKGISPGSASITVKDNDTGATSKITVTVEKPSFSLNATDISFKASNIYNLSASGSNIKTAVSSNTGIFTTERTGNRTFRLKPVKPGKATVTVTNNFGEVRKATVTVTTFLRFKSMTLTAGKERDFFEDEMISADDYWDWGKNVTVANKNIAAVHVDNDFYRLYTFIGKYPGKTTINVRCGKTGATSPIAVTVKAPAFNLSASRLTIDQAKTWQVTASGSDVGKVSSSNTKVLKVSKVNSRKVQFNPVGQGKATVTITSIYGVKRTVTVTVSYKYFRAMLTSKTRTGTMVYGSTVLKGITAPAAAVSVPIGGKTYSCKADSKGNYAIQKIPVVKYGTAFKLSFKLGGQTITKTVTVGKGKSTVYTPYYTYMNTTSVPVQITNAHAGDQLVIQIGEKKYYKNITSTVSKTTVKVPISKPGKYGIKMAVKLKNKFKQDMVVFYDYVYLSDTVYVGYTKDKVKWLTYWNDPVEKSYTAYGETWYYDWEGDDGIHDAYLYFDADGKVTDWTIYD